MGFYLLILSHACCRGLLCLYIFAAKLEKQIWMMWELNYYVDLGGHKVIRAWELNDQIIIIVIIILMEHTVFNELFFHHSKLERYWV